MNVYLQILIVVAGLVAFIVLLLWALLHRSRNDRKLNMRDASLSTEELEEHAKENAQEHSISRKRNALNWPVPRMNDNYDFILSVYKGLNEDIQNKRIVPPAAEWFLDKLYIIEYQV